MRRWPLVLALVCRIAANEHRCIYVNDDSSTPAGLYLGKDTACGTGNCVTVFTLGTGDDFLRWIRNVPTGGVGVGGGYVSNPRIVATLPDLDRGCLFAVNAGSNDVAAFVYGLHDGGSLNRVPGSPFRIQGQFGRMGGGVALNPDASLLYSSNAGSDNISVFEVNPDCTLRLIQSVPAPNAPADLQVNSTGSCLAVASPPQNTIAMYDVRQGVPQEVARYLVPQYRSASGVEFSSLLDTPKLYVGMENPKQTVVASYTVNDDCTLSDLAFATAPTGRNSAVTKLTPDEDCLAVPNQNSSTLTTFFVDPATGALTLAGTFGTFAPRTAAVVFAPGKTGLNLFTNVFSPRQVVRRNFLPGCMPGDPDQQIPTRVEAPGGILRAIAVTQE